MSRSILVIPLIALLLCLCSCGESGGGKPSESDAIRALEASYTDRQAIKIITLKKTNGQGTDTQYTMWFEGELEFLKSGCMSDELSFQNEQDTWCAFHGKRMHTTRLYGKGEKRKFSGAILLVKTEKGWLRTSMPPTVKYVE